MVEELEEEVVPDEDPVEDQGETDESVREVKREEAWWWWWFISGDTPLVCPLVLDPIPPALRYQSLRLSL